MFKIYPILTVVFSLSVSSNFRIHIKLTVLFYFQNTPGLVVRFLLGNSSVSEFCMPKFQNTLSLPSSQAGRQSSYLPAFEDGIDRVFRNICTYNSDSGELPSRKRTTFRTWRKFELKYIWSCAPDFSHPYHHDFF